ncbi:hypothetical protein CLU79DRAFT_749376 [Phycomyces nitens]|nr:hypothetical protein CLU79DRAFT_749376 [Phycomyces nitens]
MDIGAFDDSLLDPQRDTDNLANLLQEKEFRYLSDPSYGTPTEYPRNYGHLNSPISGYTNKSTYSMFWLSHSPTLPSLNYSSPGSSQGYSEYDVHPQTPPAQHYNPNGRPAKYMCSKCSEEFDIKFSYKRHMETHSVDRPRFCCHLCPKYFTTKYNLNRHVTDLHK